MHHAASGFAPVIIHGEAQRLFILLGGMLSYYCGKVRAFINASTEESWIELEEGYDPDVLAKLLHAVRGMGYDLMTDELEGIEEYEDGRIRYWLCQTWFPEEEVVPVPRKELVAS